MACGSPRKGGFARAKSMSAQERRESARKAARARWARHRKRPARERGRRD